MSYRSECKDPGPWPFIPSEDGHSVMQYKRSDQWWTPCKGSLGADGYRMCSWTTTDGVKHYKRLHLVVWITYNGPIPAGQEIDHIDMDKGNNQLSNLRIVTHRQNLINARRQLGNWSRKLSKLTDGQMVLLLALPDGWRGLHFLSIRWGVSKGRLANIRAQAKKSGDRRYLGGL